MKKQFLYFFILLFFCPLFSQALSAQEIPEKLTGNWTNEKTNEWTFGFFEKFVVYQSDFWQYDTVVQKKDNYRITIEKNEKKVVLNIKPQTDSTLYITAGKDKKQLFVKQTKGFKPYPHPDTSSFKSPLFRSDTATVIGYYRNMDKLSGPRKEMLKRPLININTNDIIRYNQANYSSNIDSLGRFKIKIPVLGTQTVFIDWGRLTKMTTLEPGEVLFLYADMADVEPQLNESFEMWQNRPKDIVTMGKNARLHNELFYISNLIPIDRIPRSEIAKQSANDMEYLRHFEKQYQSKIKILKELQKTIPTLSTRTVYFKEQEMLYNFASQLLQHRFDLTQKGASDFDSPEYMEYVKKNFPTNNNINIFMASQFSYFMKDYCGIFAKKGSHAIPNSRGSFSFVPLAPIWEQLVQEGLIPADSAYVGIKRDELYPKLWIAQFTKDTIAAKKILTDNQKEVWQTYNHYFFFEDTKERFGLYIAESALHPIDSTTQAGTKELKELLYAQHFWQMIENTQSPLNKYNLQLLNEKVSLPDVKAIVMKSHNAFAKIQEIGFISLESLQSSDKLAEFTDATKLLGTILKPFKGKIIYLDIWGTWCGPCREEMEKVHPVIDAFKGKDVVFLYLANRSPEESWKNIIKKLELTGANIIHYNLPERQQVMLEQLLQVRSFPSYRVFNKEGNLINTNPPKPSEQQELINYIGSLLK